MKEQLTITIAGTTMSGKSRLTFLLKSFLREQGFEVEQIMNSDHPTEGHFDRAMGREFDQAIQSIKQTKKIKIQEMQLPRKDFV